MNFYEPTSGYVLEVDIKRQCVSSRDFLKC